MKTISRNKFMLCFRPVVDMDLVLDHPESSRRLVYFGVDQKPSPVDSPATSPISRRPRRKTFSQAVKAVVFEMILAKRVRERNASAVGSCNRLSNSSRSKRNFREDLKSSREAYKDKKTGVYGESSDSDSAPPSSCSSSSSTRESVLIQQTAELENGKRNREGEPIRKEEQRGRGRGSGLDSVVYLVLISLALTVLWGRVCAVLFTLIWLYFLPKRQVVRTEEASKRLVKTKSSSSRIDQSCRKKVIMEGLLDRTGTNRRGSIQILT